MLLSIFVITSGNMEIQMVSCQYVGAVGVLLSKLFRQRFGEHRCHEAENKGGGRKLKKD